jgi:hypothetical protein
VLLVVAHDDDERQRLQTDLERCDRNRYRVLGRSAPRRHSRPLRQRRLAGEPGALLLVDQRASRTREGRAGSTRPFRAEVPRLMASLLLLTGRILALLEPEDVSPAERLDRLLRTSPARPTRWEVERAARVLELTL